MNQQIEWLTPKTLEAIMGIKTSTQAKLRMNRKIPFSKFGKFIFYNKSEIDKLLKDNSIEASHE